MKLFDVLKDAQVDEGFLKAMVGQATSVIPGLGAAQMAGGMLGVKEKAAKAKEKLKRTFSTGQNPAAKQQK